MSDVLSRPICLALLCLLTGLTLAAQNLPPQVHITGVEVDEAAQTVTLTYDLQDPDEDACTVWLDISLDGGETFLAEDGLLTGDIGPDITPGTGKVIVWTWSETPDIYQAILRVVAEDGHVPDIQAMVDQVDSDRLLNWLSALAIPRHHSSAPSGLNAVRDTIYTYLTALGLQTAMQPVFFQGANVPNVIGRQPGIGMEEATLIVDGHYDAVTGTPGADDNASAVAATLEIARILAPYTFRKSLRYIGFSFEEQGLIGSQVYVNSGIQPWEQIEGVLNMEMIGYYSEEPGSQSLPFGFNQLFPEATQAIIANEYRGDFITVVGNQHSQSLIDAYIQAVETWVPELKQIPLAVPGNGQIAPDLRRSDHARFWDAGYKALMLTDGANFRNENYHTPGDAISTIDLDFMTQVTKATLATAAMLAEPIQVGWDTYALSDLVSVHHHHGFPCGVHVYPNPTRDVLLLQLGHCAGERLSARLFTFDGKEVLYRELRPDQEVETFTLSLPSLPAGQYLLVLDEGHSSYAQVIIVGH
jgi:hypothetical protein